MVTSNGSSLPLRSRRRSILLSTGPRIFSTASLSDRPITGSPSMWVTKSPGCDPGLGGRRVVDRRDDLDQAVLHRDLDAEAAELAAGLHLHVAVFLGVEIARMRVERGQHAVDRRLDQLLVADLLDIFGAHPLEHVAEQLELPERVRRSRPAPRPVASGRRSRPAAKAAAATRLTLIANLGINCAPCPDRAANQGRRIDRQAAIPQLNMETSGLVPSGDDFANGLSGNYACALADVKLRQTRTSRHDILCPDR